VPNNYWVKNRTQIDAQNWAESITYFDGLGRAYKSEDVDAQGNIFTEKEFDAQGRVKRVTNPFRANEAKIWTTNVYDEASRVKEVILPDGAKVKTDYGVSTAGTVGVTKQITDQAGKQRRGISDALGRMVRVVEDPNGQNLSTDYVFDTLGNLRKTIQGEQSRYFTYDSLGRLLYAKQPEQEANTLFAFTDSITNNSQWSVKYEYDDNGNITKTTDARGVAVTGVYDNFNRLKLRDYSDTTPDVSFFYDGKGLASAPAFSKGKTTKVTSTVSESRYTSFDNLGRLLQSQQLTTAAQRAGTQTPYTSSYTYNLSGALMTETYPSGRVVTNTLDQNGDLRSVYAQKANQTSAKLYLDQISYNSAGNIEKMRLGNGRWESAVYNDRQQIKQIGLGYSNNDKSLLKIDYDYGTNLENNGSLREQKISYSGLANQITQAYTYDDLNRLKSSTETVAGNATPVWKQTFNYDRFGNRTFDAVNSTTLGNCPQKQCNPLINTADNRLKKDQDNDTVNDYDYDKTGSVTLDAANQRFVYDAENRLKQFFNAGNASTNPNAVYEYDGQDKRVRKLNYQEEVVFVYNASGTLIAEYSTVLAVAPNVSYLTADHLGSPRIVTDGGGAVVSRHDYTAFGGDIAETIGNIGGRTTQQGYGKIDEVRKQYTGYERDDESGLDFAQARYYNSSHGRFTSIDPLTASANVKDPQTFNRYSYAMNSPYKFNDPLGLLSSSTSSCGSSCRNTDGGLTTRNDPPQRQQSPPPPPTAEQNADSPCSKGHMCFGPQNQDLKPYDPANNKATEEEKKIDKTLEGIFTDTGIVRGANSERNVGAGDSHYRFVDGTLHTIHIYGNESASTSSAGVYIPKEFSNVQLTSKDTVVATNPKTGEVILIAHVQVSSKAELTKNTKTVRENGTVYIGKIGGAGGQAASDGRGIHSHLVYFPSEKSRLVATAFKRDPANNNEYENRISTHLSDFRKFVKK
jgi:RHS repeat-associated protein